MTEGVKVIDSSGTEVDEDVFEDIVNDPSTGVLTIRYDTGLFTFKSSWLHESLLLLLY